jgi:hypothetical protein
MKSTLKALAKFSFKLISRTLSALESQRLDDPGVLPQAEICEHLRRYLVSGIDAKSN